jgi:hypothetical protein
VVNISGWEQVHGDINIIQIYMKEERDNWGNNIGLPPEKYGTVEYERKF